MADRIEFPPEVLEFFKRTGSKGGKARARNNSPEKLIEWAKLGGRPKGSTKKRNKGGK
jgi:hypothetical protein